VPSQTSHALAPDGTTIATRHWETDGQAWATVLLLHGIAEHSGRYERTGELLAGAGIDTHAFDLRGHGRSGGGRTDVAPWQLFLDDVADRLRALADRPRPHVLLGHSLGSLLALQHAERHGRSGAAVPVPDLLVLSGLTLDAAIPAHLKLVARALARVAPMTRIGNPIDGAQLSRDPAVGRAYFADPLVTPKTTVRMGVAFVDAMAEARRNLPRLAIPTLALHGGQDTLVPARVSEPIAALPIAERRVYPGLRHEILNEPEGPEVVAEIVEWIRKRAQGVPATVPEQPVHQPRRA
jgi:alpha-beta hydrolase superfamily lysophospholipase